MALFGLPLASLILGVPLGVDLAYLNAAANKTGTSGTSQIAASGIRLELIQALKEEYAAFAAIDNAAVAQALKDEKETWESERYKEEDPTLGSRALGALGTLIAAPVALPVAAAAYGTRKLIALMKSRAAAKRAAAEAATAARAPNAGALVIKADAAAKVAVAAAAAGQAAEADSGKAAVLLAKLKDWFKSNPEYNADGGIQAPVNNPFVNPAAPEAAQEAAAPEAASANMFGPSTDSAAAEVNPFAPPPSGTAFAPQPDPSMNWVNGPAAPAAAPAAPAAPLDVAPAAPAARGLFSFLPRPGPSVAPVPVDPAAAAQKKLDDLWAAVRDPVLWKGGFFRRGTNGEALYDAVPSETRKAARDPATGNTLLAEAAANLNVPAFKFLVAQDDMAPLLAVKNTAEQTVFDIVLNSPVSRETLIGNRKVAARETLRNSLLGVRKGGKHRRRKTSRKLKGGAETDREDVASALVARASQRAGLGASDVCPALTAARDTFKTANGEKADEDPVYEIMIIPTCPAPPPRPWKRPSKPPPSRETLKPAFQSAPLVPLPPLPAEVGYSYYVTPADEFCHDFSSRGGLRTFDEANKKFMTQGKRFYIVITEPMSGANNCPLATYGVNKVPALFRFNPANRMLYDDDNKMKLNLPPGMIMNLSKGSMFDILYIPEDELEPTPTENIQSLQGQAAAEAPPPAAPAEQAAPAALVPSADAPAAAAPAAAPDVLAHSIAAVAPNADSSAPVDRVCDNRVYADERAKLIDALSKRKVDDIADTWAKMLQACGDFTPPPRSLTAFRDAKTREDQVQAIINVILSIVKNKTISEEKGMELLGLDSIKALRALLPADAPTGGKRRRRKTPKRKRVRKARNSTFRRHRKH